MTYPDDRRILMTPGPVVFGYEHLKSMLSTSLEHTSKDFAYIFSQAIKNLRKILQCRGSDSKIFILPGSGTLAMEIALINIVPKDSKVLIVSHGYFGDRWIEISKAYGYSINVLKSKSIGKVVDVDHIIKTLDNDRFSAVLVNHVETSVGVRIDLKELSRELSKRDEILIVDGISSVGAEELYMDSWGIDVVVTSSQKALETPPGLGIIALGSDKVIDNIESASNNRKYYMDLKNWIDIMEAYEEGSIKYFATPATHLIAVLNSSLEKIILNEGIEKRFERHKVIAESIRAGVKGMGLRIVAENESFAANTLTAVYLPKGIDPMKLRYEMMKRNIIIANPLHKDLLGKYVRIGHMGAVNANDAVSTIASLERSLRSLGADIEIGSGVNETLKVLEKYKY